MRLSVSEKQWATAALDAMIPRGGPGPEQSASDCNCLLVLDDMVTYLPAYLGLSLRSALLFMEFFGPLFGGGGLHRFSRLIPLRREVVLARLLESRFFLVRQMAFLIKGLASFGYGADDRVRESLGMMRPARFVRREAK